MDTTTTINKTGRVQLITQNILDSLIWSASQNYISILHINVIHSLSSQGRGDNSENYRALDSWNWVVLSKSVLTCSDLTTCSGGGGWRGQTPRIDRNLAGAFYKLINISDGMRSFLRQSLPYEKLHVAPPCCYGIIIARVWWQETKIHKSLKFSQLV